MRMDRERLVIEGAAGDDGVRVELATVGTENLRLDLLHDPTAANYAKVYRASVRLGDVDLGIAFKVQRDEPGIRRETPGAVVTKFNAERQIHRRLQNGGGTAGNRGRQPIVRQMDLWPTPVDEAETLPPSILCRHAKHALALRCPECARVTSKPPELLPREDLDSGETTILCCPKGHEFGIGSSSKVLAESVGGHDPACRACALGKPGTDVCLNSSVLLNFFPARVLIFELLDLDLADYLAWVSTGPPPGRSAERYVDHRRAVEASGAPPLVRRIRRTTRLMRELLQGVKQLHLAGVSHLDLKPHNVCLRFDGEIVSASIIDLGLASAPEAVLAEGLEGGQARDSLFAPPEVCRPKRVYPGVTIRSENAGQRLQLAVELVPKSRIPRPTLFDLQDPPFAVNDEVQIPILNSSDLWVGRVVAVAYRPDGRGQTADVVPISPGSGPDVEAIATVTVVRHKGQAADCYSLGLIAFALLTENPDPSVLLRNWEDVCQAVEQAGVAKEPESGWLRHLIALKRQSLQDYFSGLARDAKDAPWARHSIDRLLALAIDCTVRSPNGPRAVQDRSSSSDNAIKRALAALDEAERGLTHFEQREAAIKALGARSKAVERWCRLMEATKDGRPIGEFVQSVDRNLTELAMAINFEKAAPAILETVRAQLATLAAAPPPPPPRSPPPPPSRLEAAEIQAFGDLLAYAHELRSSEPNDIKEFLAVWQRQRPSGTGQKPPSAAWRQTHSSLFEVIRQHRATLGAWIKFRKRLDGAVIAPARAACDVSRPHGTISLDFRPNLLGELFRPAPKASSTDLPTLFVERVLTDLAGWLDRFDEIHASQVTEYQAVLRTSTTIQDRFGLPLRELIQKAEQTRKNLTDRHVEWISEARRRLRTQQSLVAWIRLWLLPAWHKSYQPKSFGQKFMGILARSPIEAGSGSLRIPAEVAAEGIRIREAIVSAPSAEPWSIAAEAKLALRRL
jgi:serine/threonine protein kinase